MRICHNINSEFFNFKYFPISFILSSLNNKMLIVFNKIIEITKCIQYSLALVKMWRKTKVHKIKPPKLFIEPTEFLKFSNFYWNYFLDYEAFDSIGSSLKVKIIRILKKMLFCVIPINLVIYGLLNIGHIGQTSRWTLKDHCLDLYFWAHCGRF